MEMSGMQFSWVGSEGGGELWKCQVQLIGSDQMRGGTLWKCYVQLDWVSSNWGGGVEC